MVKIWYQSAAEMRRSGKYSEQLQAHFKRVVDPGTEVHLHGVPPGTWMGKLLSELLRYPAIFHAALGPVFIGNAIKAAREGCDPSTSAPILMPFCWNCGQRSTFRFPPHRNLAAGGVFAWPDNIDHHA